MTKSSGKVEQDLRFQLDLVRLAEALHTPKAAPGYGSGQQAGAMEELVRVQRKMRPGKAVNI